MEDNVIDSLRVRHAQLQQHEPKLRIRERAARLGVSEAELVAADCGVVSTELAGTPQELFNELGSLGQVMALTRNDWCVHERRGAYLDIKAKGSIGLVLGPDIDLRMFFDAWGYCYAVNDSGRDSIQFFDKAGQAVHKVYQTEHTDAAAWDAYIARFAAPTKRTIARHIFEPLEEAAKPSDPAALRAHWLGLRDTHDFFSMLREFKVSRLGALRAAGTDLAQEVPEFAAESMLTRAADTGLSIMCFVANRGMVQIHTGPVKKLARTGPWFNVLDEKFSLHLNTDAVTSSWVVNKPTADGWVTSLELFAPDGQMIVQFFGERKPGRPELSAWRELLASLCAVPLAA